MNSKTWKPAVVALMAMLGAAACGGGGGGGGGIAPPPAPPPPPPPGGGIDRSGVAIGTITGFGSIFVNGIEFETESASFMIDDAPGTEDALAVGQIVTVLGTLDDDGLSGTAETVIFDDNVEGPITSIDVPGGELIVLGQTVRVGDDTSFDDGIIPASIEGLAVGDVVEVSGFVDADGAVSATRIELKPAGGEFELTGIVANLDDVNFRFDIAAQTIDYSSAMLDDFAGGTISEGDRVEVKGTSFGPGGELLATRVEREDGGVDFEDGDEVEVEGLVTRFASAEDFDVAGIAVTTNDQTVFENGTADDLVLGVKVEAEGAFNADGVLVARKISFRLPDNVRIEAPVEAVDAAAGTLSLLGIDIVVSGQARFEDNSDLEERSFSLDDLNAGDFVELRGTEDPPGSDMVLASRIEREDAQDEVVLQGLVDTIAEPDLVILGVTVQTGAGTEFEGVNDNPISSAEFFGSLSVGTLVKAKGTDLGGQTLAAEEVELEGPED